MRCRARDGAYEAARDRGVGAPRSVDAGPEGRSVRKLYLAADDAPSGGEDRQAAGGRPVAVHGRRPRRDLPCEWARVRLRYDERFAARGVAGLVHVRFYIEPDGKVTIGEVLSSPDEKLSREVIRVIKASKGHWVPRRVRGVPQRTAYEYRINFT
ncbi:MAG: energy transducer TonB [Alistipes onderdonkii]